MDDCAQIKPLLMGMMDGELTPEQSADVTRHLNRCQACRDEIDALRQACDPLRDLVFEEPDLARAERLWRAPFSHVTRLAGLLLVLVSVLALVGIALVEMIRDHLVNGTVKVALCGIVAGFIILFANVVLQRWASYRNDPYKEVEK